MGSPTIILIDDDYFIRDVACQLLAVNFPDVSATDSPETVLDWAEKLKPELIITDACLPGSGGFQLLQRIRKVSVNTRVLLLTGYCDLVCLREGIRLGFNGYVMKQLAGTELSPAVRCVLRGQLYVSPFLYRHPSSCFPSRISSSVRQQDVNRLAAKNFSTKEIAHILNISAKTVARYRYSGSSDNRTRSQAPQPTYSKTLQSMKFGSTARIGARERGPQKRSENAQAHRIWSVDR